MITSYSSIISFRTLRPFLAAGPVDRFWKYYFPLLATIGPGGPVISLKKSMPQHFQATAVKCFMLMVGQRSRI